MLDDLMEAISDKVMETGLLTSCVEDGDLATVSLSVKEEEGGFQIMIDLGIDDREDQEVGEDEWDNITETIAHYFTEKQFWPELEKLGFAEEKCYGFDVQIQLQ